MTWLRIDDGFVDHERVEPLTDKAFRLHVTGMCLCARKLTDGKLTPKDVQVCLSVSGANRRTLLLLIEAGLWIPEGSSYSIRDYLDYNPSAEKVRADRKRAAERMKNVRANVQANVPSNVQANNHTSSRERSPTPSRPLKDKPFLPSLSREDREGTEGTETLEQDEFTEFAVPNILKDIA